MEQFEATTHPFIVRIWLEETAAEAGRATWRGYVTHVPSGERRYIHTLDEIAAFIAPYVESMGVRLPESGALDRRTSWIANLRGFVSRLSGAGRGRQGG
jgi:hypothetical protein